jgi:hypothetical protein
MAEFASARASITGSAIPIAGYSSGAEHTFDPQAGVAESAPETEAGQEGGGNTVTFGGVETFSKTNSSTAGSTVGALTEGGFCFLYTHRFV